MEHSKGEQIRLTIRDMTENGEGIGSTADSFTWFVQGAVTGDEVEAEAVSVKKNYGFANTLRIVTPSPNRTEPRCAVAQRCGGCQLQELNYESQLRFKEKKVFGDLARIGAFSETLLRKVMAPILGMDCPWHFRGHEQFPVGKDKEGNYVCGFYEGRSHTIVPAAGCEAGIAENAAILCAVLRYLQEFSIKPCDESHPGGLVRRVQIRKGFATGEIMVCLILRVGAGELKNPEALISRLLSLFPKGAPSFVKTVCTVTEGRGAAGVRCLYGPGTITERIKDVTYRISPLSFFQVNPRQTERLYETVLAFAALSGKETVWDVYCGTGAISLFLARQAKQVFGVESVPQAVDDARENVVINGSENVKFFCGKAEEILPKATQAGARADVVVVDPPRKGCERACLDAILCLKPSRIVYVSCDPATLARDLKILCESFYSLCALQPVDMFPQTVHVEIVSALTRR